MESTRQSTNAIKEVRKLFNSVRNNLFNEETKIIRKELHKKKPVYTFLKGKEQEGTITNKEKNMINYLFNEVNEEDYYEPKEIRSAFDGTYTLYESRGDKDNMLAVYEYFDKIKPYLKDMIDDYKSKDEWKIQLVMRVIFVSFIHKNETQIMHTKSDNVKNNEWY